ncbi:MAG: restriction endonuclease subunit S [Gemmatimonadetes bacterium]|nr:restriction endonuclease subunit S [Gemmatimonadota bacterium]
MSFPRYLDYKDSWVEWLGEVPAHWECPPMYMRYEIALGKMLDEKKNPGTSPLPYLRNVDVQWDRINIDDLPTIDISPREQDRFTLRPGDLLVCEGGEVGRASIWCGELATCAYQKALHRLRPITRNETPHFLRYVLRFAATLGVFDAGGNPNTISHLTAEAFRQYRFPRPPLNEQRAIAAFLDRETAKIDALVAEQERLIALLQEKRQAVITHAVTKGLDPDVPMKDSGVEWVGEVPAHWTVTRLGNLFREVVDSGDEALPILSVSIHSGVSDDEIDPDELDRKVTRSDDRSKYKRVAPDDLVYNMMRAWQGGFGTVSVEGMVSPAYVVARPRGEISTRFVELLLRTPQAIEQMRRHSRGVTDFRLRLYWDEFKNIQIAMPPVDEAVKLCARADEIARDFESLSGACREAIKLLLARRAALITAAVTGQIDVRAIASAH